MVNEGGGSALEEQKCDVCDNVVRLLLPDNVRLYARDSEFWVKAWVKVASNQNNFSET